MHDVVVFHWEMKILKNMSGDNDFSKGGDEEWDGQEGRVAEGQE